MYRREERKEDLKEFSGNSGVRWTKSTGGKNELSLERHTAISSLFFIVRKTIMNYNVWLWYLTETC